MTGSGIRASVRIVRAWSRKSRTTMPRRPGYVLLRRLTISAHPFLYEEVVHALRLSRWRKIGSDSHASSSAGSSGLLTMTALRSDDARADGVRHDKRLPCGFVSRCGLALERSG